MTTINIFEQASRNALRFPTSKGDLTTEQLWQLPLTSNSGFDLDTIAKRLNAALKATAEESFVQTVENPANERLTLSLDLVKHVIAVKIAENAARRDAAAIAAKRAELKEILAEKLSEQTRSLSVEDITKQLAALG